MSDRWNHKLKLEQFASDIIWLMIHNEVHVAEVLISARHRMVLKIHTTT